MLELIPVALALGGVCAACYTDLKDRIIPNKLTYPLIGIGVGFYLVFEIYEGNFYRALFGAVGGVLAFGIGYALWLTGGWAGGDVKLFTALGALLPAYSAPRASPFYSTDYPFFPITILFNSIIAIIPVLLVYAAICRIKGGGAFYDEIKITELKEGMIPAETIYEKGGKVERYSAERLSFLAKGAKRPNWDRILTDPRRAAGVSRYQVGVLRRLVREGKLRNHIRIKRGMPFAPALWAGVVIGVFYGDLYWSILRAFTGG